MRAAVNCFKLLVVSSMFGTFVSRTGHPQAFKQITFENKMHIYIYIYIYRHTHTHTHTHIYICISVSVCVCVCVCVCVSVCARACVRVNTHWISYIYIYIYIYNIYKYKCIFSSTSKYFFHGRGLSVRPKHVGNIDETIQIYCGWRQHVFKFLIWYSTTGWILQK